MQAIALLIALPLAAQTTGDLLARYLAAQGGIEKLETVKTKRITGRIEFGGKGGPLVVEFKRPAKIREEVTLAGVTYIRGYDGSSGWQQSVQNGQTKGPEKLSDDDTGNIAAEADFDGALVDAKAKGNRVEYAGRATVDGKSAFKLKARLKDGNVFTFYLDPDSYLETKWEGGRNINGREVVFTSIFKDYRRIEGVPFAFRIDSSSEGPDQGQALITEKVELNVPLDDSRFAMPSAAQGAAPESGLLGQLAAVEKGFFEAWKTGHPEYFELNQVDEGIFFGEYGVAPKKDTVDQQKQGGCDVKSYALTDFQLVSRVQDMAVITYRAEQHGTCGGETFNPYMNGLSVYVERGGKWLNLVRSEVPAKDWGKHE